jgi:NAD(P)-dependent dehydrogenase (short-subunit alcohol dehydrogenase family)
VSDRQTPIGSGFGVTTTALEAIAGIDLSGTTAIVTGGASGIGVETVRALRDAGATVVVPARDIDRAGIALHDVGGVELEAMDLMEPASIDAFADRFLAGGRPLHILVNNAGIGSAPLTRDVRGCESHFATNHLGHFQLTARLWPALRSAPAARVVAVSSWAHRYSPVVLDDPNYERRPYDPAGAYGQSKTANILFAVALDERGRADGVRAFSLHPGSIVDSNFKRNTPDGLLEAFGMIDEHGAAVIDPSKGWKTIEQGAATNVWCATSPQLAGLGGVYAQDCDVAPLVLDVDPIDTGFGPAALGVYPYALDPESAEQLWTLSEELTGTSF